MHDGNSARIEPLVRGFLDSGLELMRRCTSGEGIFRRDLHETRYRRFYQSYKFGYWYLKMRMQFRSSTPGQFISDGSRPITGFRFAIGETLRRSQSRATAERLEEFLAYDGLIGAMARALFTVGRTSQTESKIALAEWLRLEAQFARAEVVDEARVQSGTSQRLFDLWVEAYSKAP